MRFLIVTQVPHKIFEGKIYSYGPYIREINIWSKTVGKLVIIAPVVNIELDPIDTSYSKENIFLVPIPAINIIGFPSIIHTIRHLPKILWILFREMSKTDHIHLRCPGNMGLLGLIVQFFLPFKKKTVKYAGNWDNYPNEEWSYRLQKQLARNFVWSRNMKVLIYGQWPDFTRNCHAFFTASFKEEDKLPVMKRSLSDEVVNLLFVGTLDERKRPEYAIEVLKILQEKGFHNFKLTIIGVGPFEQLCREKIEAYGLKQKVELLGNLSISAISNYANKSHFLIFLSRMEGWPKVVAECMWWGCLPVTTRISCVPWMLNEGERGVLVDRDPIAAANALEYLMLNSNEYQSMQDKAIQWARNYTLELFESEILKLL